MPEFKANWTELLKEALEVPGIVSKAYGLFYDYSMANVMWVLIQCKVLGIEAGPIANFKTWKKMGRHITSGKGSGLGIFHPWFRYFTKTNEDTGADETVQVLGGFKWKRTVWVLSQTDGKD